MGEQGEKSARLTSLAKEWPLFITPSLVASPRTTSSHLVQWTQSPFAPENLVPRDGFGSPVPVSLLISILRLNLVLTYGIPPEFRGGVHLFI